MGSMASSTATPQPFDPHTTDPSLLKKHSEIRTFSTARNTYPNLRIFYRQHPKADQLPSAPAPLPLLVFIHGLGGSVSQFQKLLNSLVHVSSCLAADLPGCGRSDFELTRWDAYKIEDMAELLANIIDEYRDKENNQGVVLIGHSMGCALAAMVASKLAAPRSAIADHVMGVIAICPVAAPLPEKLTSVVRALMWLPTPIVDLWRSWDRRGGLDSTSVVRFVGADADIETKKLQQRFNEQSRTPVWRRMLFGSLSTYKHGAPEGGLPKTSTWAGIEAPIYLVGGEADTITKPEEVEKIAAVLKATHTPYAGVTTDGADNPSTVNASSPERGIASITEQDFARPPAFESEDTLYEDPITPQERLSVVPPQPSHPQKVLRTTIMPAPAAHSLLYMPLTSRTLAGLMAEFLAEAVSPRLSLAWQLRFLSTAGKWDVKNLAKWQAVSPVSEDIGGIFCAMKTLREVDELHSPVVFVKNWAAKIKDIVDISHDTPVYDPKGLEQGGIHYHKFPTVSKLPPTDEEVAGFIDLVDRLRAEQKSRAATEHWEEPHYVGVHCHYGFNRTGFFIACYLVERCGYTIQKAVDEFAQKRPQGIKHAHFLDRLFVRYSGLT